jgi:hypothetical protein
MTSTVEPFRFDRTSIVAALTFFLLALVGNALHQTSWLLAQDDQMYTLAAAISVVRPESAVAQEAIAELTVRATGQHLVERATLRWEYRENYIAILYLIDAVGGFAKYPHTYPDFARRAATGLSIGPLVASALAALLVALIILTARNVLLALATATLAVVACVQGMIDLGGSVQVLGNFAEGQHFGFVKTIYRICLLILDPGASSFIFGTAPRCIVTLMLVAMFLLRWTGRFVTAYAIFLPMTFVHQSETGILLVMLVMIDAIMRPRLLLRPSVAFFVLGAALVFLLRERLWVIVGTAGALILLLLMGAVAGLLAWRYAQRRISDPDDFRLSLPGFGVLPAELSNRLGSMGVMASDVLLLALGLAALFFVTWLGNWFASASQSNFFWNHIAGRMMGTFEPVFLLAGIYAGLEWLARRFSLQSVVSSVGRGVVVATGILLALVQPWSTIAQVIDRNTNAMNALEREILPIKNFEGEDEAVFYYALAKSLATGEPIVRRLWQ